MKFLLLGILMIGSVGCTGLQPIGPLAHGKKSLPPKGSLDADAPEPTMVSAPKPIPPAMLIVPGEVNSDNASAAAQKLANEYEYDWKSMPPPSKTAEISRYRGGMKQN